MQLREPDVRYHASYVAALEEFSREGNAQYLAMVHPADSAFPGVHYDLEALRDPETFADFCAYTRQLEHEETPRPAGWVTGTYLWMVEDDEVVGRISFRHELTPHLLEIGGHIGYGVRPTARRRGHAGAAVAQMLPRCAARGLDRVLITCDEDNVASRKVIENSGGVLEDCRQGKLRFWVPTG
jgi:predicted acetyltransferase